MKELIELMASRFSASQRFSCSARTRLRRRRSSVSEMLMRRRRASSSSSASTNKLTARFLTWRSLIMARPHRLCARLLRRSPGRKVERGGKSANPGIRAPALPGSSNRDAVHAQGGLADADGHPLAVLAAGADAGIELEVVADHADPVEVGRAIADQHGALERLRQLAVRDLVGLGH